MKHYRVYNENYGYGTLFDIDLEGAEVIFDAEPSKIRLLSAEEITIVKS